MPIKVLIKTFVRNYQLNCKCALYRSHCEMGTFEKITKIYVSFNTYNTVTRYLCFMHEHFIRCNKKTILRCQGHKMHIIECIALDCILEVEMKMFF